MFSKLLKYDMRSLRRIGIPVLIVILVAAVLGSACVAWLVSGFGDEMFKGDSTADTVFSTISILTASFGAGMMIFVIIGGVSLIEIFVCVDFYKNLVSDEGYLTFTLPVRSKDIILSKLVNAIIWTLIAFAAMIVAFIMMIFAGVIFSGIDFSSTGGNMSEVDSSLAEALGITGVGEVVGVVLLVVITILNLFASLVTSILLYFLAIFLGSVIVKKNKVLAAIGLVLGFNFVYSMVYNTINTVITVIMGAATDTSSFLLGYNIGYGIQLIFVAGMGVLFYYLLKYLMDHKLNLA